MNNGSDWIGKNNANSIEKRFVFDLTKSIWYVNICSYKTLNDKFKFQLYLLIFALSFVDVNYLNLAY